MASHIFMIVLLVLGFGFVIFFHELGHFLAAKYVGIRVEQFAVGFGHALLAWRKGLGFHVGTTTPIYEMKLVDAYRARHVGAALAAEISPEDIPPIERQAIATQLGLGDTEYRLNWMPLGGYVKMLGQDDLRPNAVADDPRAYNHQSIRARMLVVSAGVFMNIVLAIIGFMIVFRMGFNVPPATVGDLLPGSPAQQAGLHVGDTIVSINGRYQSDFTKIQLNTALLPAGQSAAIVVNRAGKDIPLTVFPRLSAAAGGVLAIGIGPIRQLTGLPAGEAELQDPDKIQNMLPADVLSSTPGKVLVEPGDRITAIDGQPVGPNDYAVLDAAMQRSPDQGVLLTITGTDGTTHTGRVFGHFMPPFDQPPADSSEPMLSFGGLVPRARVEQVEPGSPALGKLMPGDVIAAIKVGQKITSNPTPDGLRTALKAAADQKQKIDLTVLRGDKTLPINGLAADMHLGAWYQTWRKGLGILPAYDEAHCVVGAVAPGSSAAKAKIPAGATITAINGSTVSNWYQVQRIFGKANDSAPVRIAYTDPTGLPHAAVNLSLTSEQIASARDMRYGNDNLVGMLTERITPLKEPNVVMAAWRGFTETRDFMLQFYLSIRRMLSGSISVSGLAGPIGIFRMGIVFAYRGMDWLIWFLSMISVNLAVVNFLPIPIVDGGLFTFLIIEKLQGKPISPRVTAIAQYVGLAFLVGVFLFVTYHDILR